MGGIKAPAAFVLRAKSFDVWPSSDNGSSLYGTTPGVYHTLGTIGLKYTLIGKKAGATVVAAVTVTDTARTPPQSGTDDFGYWHHIDLSATGFATTDIDAIEFVNAAQTGATMNYLAVDNFAYSNFGAATTGPVVTLNPVDTTVNAGGTAIFTAAASGAPTPTVQWQFSTNGGASFGDVAGATSTTLTLPSVAAGQNGTKVRAVFTNASGTATTAAATMTVNFAPSVTTNPVSQTVAVGTVVNFVGAASGNPVPTVQWQLSTNGGATFTNIAGATGTTLSFTAQLTDNSNQYRAVFTNSVGSATTTAATLTTNRPPTVGNAVAQTRAAGTGFKIAISQLLTLGNVTDPDGDPVTVTGGTATGGTVAVAGGLLFYTPNAGNTSGDTITYTVSDGRGGTANGTINVTVPVDNAPTNNIAKFTKVSGGPAELDFAGIPGLTYGVQYKLNLGDPAWLDIGPVTMNGVGAAHFTDNDPVRKAAAQGFYRFIYPAPAGPPSL